MVSSTENTNPPAESSAGSALQAWVRALEETAAIAVEPRVTFPILFDRLADQFGAAPALVGEDSTLSYRALSDRANQYARWAFDERLGPRDVVCLLMPNCPEYLAAWLGITRIGATVALLNTQLTGDPLAHSVQVVAPKRIIVSKELLPGLKAALSKIATPVSCWIHGDANSAFPSLEQYFRTTERSPPPPGRYAAPSLNDRALCIYTSGTTGLPKAANVSHLRVLQWVRWFAGLIGTRSDDRMYNCLPMYHSVGGVVATGATLINGGSVIVRRRFSAREFWPDVVQSRSTLFQYIGELCRYLVNSPPQGLETQHRLRLCCGNGLRADVWTEFQRRFRIPWIVEYYASTEGTFSLYNCEGKVGAIGRIPAFLSHRLPVAIVKSDPDSGEPVRDQNGFCIRCGANEVGEAIGKIQSAQQATGTFEGYTDEAASARKVLADVFASGDRWYRTGDLMRKDPQGFFYFVDRIGDTFRWKGENVSTAEVAEIISRCSGVLETVVYGVTIAKHEGRAGMTAVVVNEHFCLDELYRHNETHLPEYARPLFVRLLSHLESTATFKPKKQDLQREGFDPGKTGDRVYFSDRSRGGFVALDAALFAALQSGRVRF